MIRKILLLVVVAIAVVLGLWKLGVLDERKLKGEATELRERAEKEAKKAAEELRDRAADEARKVAEDAKKATDDAVDRARKR